MESNAAVAKTGTATRWICLSCGFIYDPSEGDPYSDVPSGTAFGDLPDDWLCPVCGARKSEFEPYEEGQRCAPQP
jgi:rubredoxin